MKGDSERNKQTLAQDAVFNHEARTRIKDYLARTGMTTADLAIRAGYAPGTVLKYLSDNYHLVSGTTRTLVAALDHFMALHPIEAPTQVHGDLYETDNAKAIRDTFQKLLPHPVAYMIYAPPGSQKSFVLQHEVARLNLHEVGKHGHNHRAYYVYARQNIRPRDIVRRVAIACGSRATGSIDTMLANLRFDFQGRRVLLIIDEAQHLSLDCFEVLRELLDQPPYFSLLLSGSHDLKAFFDRFSATLEQWNSRIIAKVLLPGLKRDEARGIVLREIGHILAGREHLEECKVIDALIDAATVQDAYAGKQKYINIRTLSNSLDQIKARAPKAASGK